MSWKKRAWRTCLQAFCGAIAGNVVAVMTLILAEGVTRDDIIRAIIIQLIAPAISAGMAALMNLNEGEEDE